MDFDLAKMNALTGVPFAHAVAPWNELSPNGRVRLSTRASQAVTMAQPCR